MLIDTTVATRIQLDTRGDMRGRVLAAAAMASAAAGATGAPLLGWLAEAVGPREALIMAGTVAGLASLVAGAMLARRRGVAVRPHQLRLALAAAVGWPLRQPQVAGATLAQPVPA